MRKEADKQKQVILEAFEQMKRKGKIDNMQLNKYGLTIEIKEDPNLEQEAAS